MERHLNVIRHASKHCRLHLTVPFVSFSIPILHFASGLLIVQIDLDPTPSLALTRYPFNG